LDQTHLPTGIIKMKCKALPNMLTMGHLNKHLVTKKDKFGTKVVYLKP
jgi:hypothetical protein